MTCYAMPLYVYEDIKNDVPHGEPFHYKATYGTDCVEVDVDEETFRRVATERGWIA